MPYLRQQERIEFERKLGRIPLEAGPAGSIQTAACGTAAGELQKLRGLPAIGPGVSAAIPGTSPHGAVPDRRADAGSSC
jgi:hypothetical protein